MKKLKDSIHLLRIILRVIISLPKTIYFNFKYLSFSDAIKLPILVNYRVRMKSMGGKVIIKSDIERSMIKIGFGYDEYTGFDKKVYPTEWIVWGGTVEFHGKAFIAYGVIIEVASEGELIMGERLFISPNTMIRVRKKVKFGYRCMVAFSNLIMDTDFHNIRSMESNEILNPDKEIVFGDQVWIASKCIILKGTKVGNDCVIASGTLLCKEIDGNNQIIAGNPGRVVKNNIMWEK